MEIRSGNERIISDFDTWRNVLVEIGSINELSGLDKMVTEKFLPCAVIYGRANDTWRMKDKTNVGPHYALKKFMEQYSDEDYFMYRLAFFTRKPEIAVEAARHLNLDVDVVQKYFKQI